MAYRDGYSNFSFFHALDTETLAATTSGKDVDTRGYATCTFVVTLGRCSHVSTLSYWVLRLQHTSASVLNAGPSDYTDCASIDLITESGGAITSGIWQQIIAQAVGTVSTQGSQNHQVGYIGGRRYVRVVVELLSTASVMDVGAVAILGRPTDWPVNASTQ